jgi:hypothetical protein
METHDKAATSGNGERENSINRFTRIDGVARKTAEALVQIGLYGYADLAQYLSQHTAQQISVALQEQGVNRPPGFIDRAMWTRQARAFGELEEVTPTPPEEETVPAEGSEEVPSGRDPWAHDAQLEIAGTRLSIIGPTSGVPERRLKAEIDFCLSGTEAEALVAQGIPFRIEGYIVDTESGVSELVASDRSRLVPQVLEYVSQQEFGIPAEGHYEFHSIVLLLPPGAIAAYHRGPTMKVVP